MIYKRILATVVAVAAVFSTPVLAISEEQQGAISQYCGTIRQTLQVVQRTDSRWRTRLGTRYETIYSHYLDPLNHRLLENGLLNSAFSLRQTDFIATRAEFSSSFKTYSDSLSELIAYDCQNDPDGFYEKLLEVRTKREIVHAAVLGMDDVIAGHRNDVFELRNSYE